MGAHTCAEIRKEDEDIGKESNVEGEEVDKLPFGVFGEGAARDQ